MPDQSPQFTTTGMISALFHFERKGDHCVVTCSLLPEWEVHCKTVNEFLIWWRGAMNSAAADRYMAMRESR